MTKPVFSNSRLTAHDTCPLMWEYNYIENISGESNFYAHYGTFAHLIFELFALGKIDNTFEVWMNHYQKRVLYRTNDHEIPPWEKKWKAEGSWFFDEFKGFEGETVWTEQHILLEFERFKFQGFVDRLESRGKDLVMIDFKSSKPFIKKDIEQKGRQMYLYSRGVKEMLGKYPKQLEFLHFRQNKKTVIDFSLKEYNAAVDWAKRKVDEILEAEEFPANPSYWFCNNLCNYRSICNQKG